MRLVPPSSHLSKRETGWDYIEDGLIFSGSNETEVVDKLRDYRIANGIPIGNIIQEVLDYNDSKTKEVIPVKSIPNLREKVVKWLESRLRVKPRYVNPDEASRRAAICSQCPRNVAWQKGEKCGKCVENARRAVAIILMGRKQYGLGACEVLFQENNTAVNLDEAPLVDPGLPSFCWKLDKVDTKP